MKTRGRGPRPSETRSSSHRVPITSYEHTSTTQGTSGNCRSVQRSATGNI